MNHPHILFNISLIDTSGWVGMSVFIGSILVMAIWSLVIKKRRGKSDPRIIFIYGNDVVIFSNVFHSGGDTGDAYNEGRIVFLNAATGNITARILLKEEIRDTIQYRPLALLDSNNRYTVVDLKRRVILFTTRMFLKNNPGLKNEGIYSIDFDKDTLSILIRSKKDKLTKIDLTSLTNEPLEETHRLNQKGSGAFQFKASNSFIFNGNEHRVDVDILRPIKLMETENTCVIMNREDISDTGDFSFVKLGSDGKILWTIQRSQVYHVFPNEFEIIYNETLGTDLIVGIKANWSRVFCIDTNSGTVRWNYRI